MNRRNYLLVILIAAILLGAALSSNAMNVPLGTAILFVIAIAVTVAALWFYRNIWLPNQRLRAVLAMEDPDVRIAEIEAQHAKKRLSDVQYHNLMSVAYLDKADYALAQQHNQICRTLFEEAYRNNSDLLREMRQIYLHNECFNLLFIGDTGALEEVMLQLQEMMEAVTDKAYLQDVYHLVAAKLALSKRDSTEARGHLNLLNATAMATGAAWAAKLLEIEYDVLMGENGQAEAGLQRLLEECQWPPVLEAAKRMTL